MTRTHGLSKTHPLYQRWMGMRARCMNPGHPSYPRYGGRGVRVCSRWDDFAVFVADMEPTWPGPEYELHRVDENGDYEYDNCQWIRRRDHRAMPKSEEHRAKIGAAHRGRPKSPEHAAKSGEAHRAPLDPDWLRDAYVSRCLTIAAIAAEAGVGKSSVHRALHRLRISR